MARGDAAFRLRLEAMSELMDETFDLPIDGVLDLHTFAPADVKELVADYLDECARADLLEVRIIHGKGTGTCAAWSMRCWRSIRWWWPSGSATSTRAAGARPW